MAKFFGGLLFFFAVATFANGMSRVKRLAGGIAAQNGQYPYMAAIKYENILVCGGAIISPSKILTAANCVDKCLREKVPEFRDCKKSMTIVTGSASLSKGGNIYRVKSVKVPDNFILGKFAHDIAIITLESPIKYSVNEKPVDLPDKDITENTVGSIGGWGAILEKERFSDNLQSTKETIISNDNCNQFFKDKAITIDANDFCAVAVDGTNKAGLCIGDSGNPLIQDGKVIGIATWGIGCAGGYPDVFTNIYRNVNFIKSELNK